MISESILQQENTAIHDQTSGIQSNICTLEGLDRGCRRPFRQLRSLTFPQGKHCLPGLSIMTSSDSHDLIITKRTMLPCSRFGAPQGERFL